MRTLITLITLITLTACSPSTSAEDASRDEIGFGDTSAGVESLGDVTPGDDTPGDDTTETCMGIGCPCDPTGACPENLTCRDGFCGPCPAGQIGCPCEWPTGLCDSGTCGLDGFCH